MRRYVALCLAVVGIALCVRGAIVAQINTLCNIMACDDAYKTWENSGGCLTHSETDAYRCIYTDYAAGGDYDLYNPPQEITFGVLSKCDNYKCSTKPTWCSPAKDSYIIDNKF